VYISSNEFDIIILGAGISGLLLASELSVNFKVLLIDKENKIPNNKYWITNQKSIDLNPELQTFINKTYKSLDFIAYDNTRFRCKGNYYLWDTIKLINYLSSKIQINDGIIKTGSVFYSYYYSKNSIIININHDKYKSRLVIDCMGYSSPIANAHRTIAIKGYYLLFGGLLRLYNEIDPIGLYNVVIEKNPKYIEICPNNKNFAFCEIITPINRIKKSKNLKNEFNFIFKQSHLSKYFDQNYTPELNFGIVPVGILRKNALDRIIFFGEVSQINPSATATALNKMLYYYKDFAKEIEKTINNDKTSIKELNDLKINSLTSFNKKFQFYSFIDLLMWDSFRFKQFVELMNLLGSDIVNEIIFAELDIKKLLINKNMKYLLKFNNLFYWKILTKSLFVPI
jgi:hypothetical protein